MSEQRKIDELECEARVLRSEHLKMQCELSLLRARVERMDGALRELDENTYTPEPNCSCHISPPCSDCEEYGSVREAKTRCKLILSEDPTPAVEYGKAREVPAQEGAASCVACPKCGANHLTPDERKTLHEFFWSQFPSDKQLPVAETAENSPDFHGKERKANETVEEAKTENINDGGSVFPPPGMTLRDYFAAKAMQSLISLLDPRASGWDWNMIAQEADQIADAMLKIRAQTDERLALLKNKSL